MSECKLLRKKAGGSLTERINTGSKENLPTCTVKAKKTNIEVAESGKKAAYKWQFVFFRKSYMAQLFVKAA